MTELANNAAGGANGVTVTPANSGGSSGNAFDTVNISNQTLTFDTTHVRGSSPFSYKIAATGTAGFAYMLWSSLNGTSDRDHMYIYLTALPPVELGLIWAGNGSSIQASLGLLTTGKLVQRAYGSGSGVAGTGNVGTQVIPLNQWVRLEFTATAGSSTGTMQSAMYSASNGDSTTALDSLSTTAQNTGTTNITTVRLGNISTGTMTYTYWVAALRAGDTSTTFYGPDVTANNPPTVTAGAVQNINSATGSVTFSGNDTDGTISSFACTLLSTTGSTTPTVGTGVVTNPNTANASVTFPISNMSPGIHLFSGTATDNLGAVSAAATAQINYTATAPGVAGFTGTGYTVVGGGTAVQALQAGTPSSRYLQSPAPPGGAPGTITYQPLQPSSVNKAFSMTLRASDSSATITAYVYLMQGSTVIATRGPFTVTTSDATYGGTTTSSETAAITDWSALSTKVVGN